jgi:hypothetical protein
MTTDGDRLNCPRPDPPSWWREEWKGRRPFRPIAVTRMPILPRPSPTPDNALYSLIKIGNAGEMSVNRLPPVGRIRAVHLPEGGPRVPKSLTIEYSDRSNASKWYHLDVPFVDAMHLLALLQGTRGRRRLQGTHCDTGAREGLTHRSLGFARLSPPPYVQSRRGTYSADAVSRLQSRTREQCYQLVSIISNCSRNREPTCGRKCLIAPSSAALSSR